MTMTTTTPLTVANTESSWWSVKYEAKCSPEDINALTGVVQQLKDLRGRADRAHARSDSLEEALQELSQAVGIEMTQRSPLACRELGIEYQPPAPPPQPEPQEPEVEIPGLLERISGDEL